MDQDRSQKTEDQTLALNGIVWALVISVIAVVWFDDLQIGYVIAAAIIINLFVAAFSGVAIPIILQKLDIDRCYSGQRYFNHHY